MTTRQEHLNWCKTRALEYANSGNYQEAIASMLSDLGKHPETEAAGALGGMMVIIELASPTKESVTKFIQGFN
jgi:hypothetical protein